MAASLIGGIVATTIQARRAERRFQLARQLAKAVVADVKGPLGQLPGSTALRASMIQTVLQYLDGLAQDPGRDPAFELEIADAYREVASVEGHPLQQNLGQTAAALSHYQKAIAIYAETTSDRAEIKSPRIGGADRHQYRGRAILRRELEMPRRAQARLQRVAAIASEAAARDSGAVLPGTWVYLYFRLGGAERRGEPRSRLWSHYRKALEVCKAWAATDRGANARSTLRGAYIKRGRRPDGKPAISTAHGKTT